MTIFNKTFWKFAALFAVIIFLAGGAIWLDRYYQWRKSPQYQAEKYIKEMEQKYREDTYGGNTPEETLQFFIDALKNGDTDLAAKYFVVDKQEEWKNQLADGKKNDHLNLIIEIIEKPKTGKEIYDGAYLYTVIPDKNKVVEFTISLTKNKATNKWKIEDM